MEFERLFRKWKDVHEYVADSVIFSEGEPADAVFVILEGTVDLALRGRELSTEEPGSIIGITAVMEPATRNATATARTDVRLARLDSEQVKLTMDENPEFAKHLIRVLAHRLRDVDAFITTHLDMAG